MSTNRAPAVPEEWTPEAEANWKNHTWWISTGTPKDHLDLDELFQRHIHQDFQLGVWEEPVMNMEVYFVASAGGLLKRVVRGYDYSEDNYFLVDPVKGTETKVKPERIWLKPEDALIFKLREFSTEMLNRNSGSSQEELDRRRRNFRKMLRFIMQQLESL